ncbi:MAG: peptide chain release factor N(5)-glutamine methyltransferase [Chlorobi bacterium]|nr:peptide chain release factor N(5)-glutamine methyltransferase [Chlorobiota bacterium]
MLTIIESINLSEKYLKERGISEPRINAEIMLAEILSCKRLDLYLRFDRPLKEDERLKYREFLSRRGNNEPLQYILNKTEFYGLEFYVDENVLIPRPDTEILVEEIIERFSEIKTEIKILDVGTGSGNIAVALAKNIPSAKIAAIDVSEKALQIAERNAEANQTAGVDFKLVDIFNSSGEIETHNFDVIVSNPPYISKNNLEELEKEVKEREPLNALTDGGNGLSFYERICEIGKTALNENGLLFFEIEKDAEEKIGSIMQNHGYKEIETKKDFAGITRIIWGKNK